MIHKSRLFRIVVLALLILSVGPASVWTQQPLSPKEALKTFQTRPGFRIELAAAEPLVRDPIAIAFDENGRMFVVEFPEYNHRHADWKLQERGRVRVLEDTDGDGQFDRSEVYIDNLPSPTGVICYDGGIFVAAAPDILFYKDTTGDHRADLKKTVFAGFAISENRGGGARLNSLRWGLDHRIHLCTSFSGGQVRRAGDENSRPVSVRNRGFAFDPRTLKFSATSGGGQHGLAMDDWGRFFLCNNSDPFRLLMYESRYPARNPHVVAPPPYVSIAEEGKFTKLYRISPQEPWRVERTRRRVQGAYRGSAEGGTPSGFFTSATGVTVYRGDAWPDEYRGDLFVAHPSGNYVYRAKQIAKGVELIARRADQGAEFVACRDNWFRPIELANAPDGNLYIVDMHRELIETALALPPDVLGKLKPGAGVKSGRIYRIVAEGFQRRPAPRLGDATTAELVALLEHRNGWHRDTASRLLFQRQDCSAVAMLKKLAAKSKFPQGRMTALYALEGLEILLDDSPSRHLPRKGHDSESRSTVLDAQTMLAALNDSSALVRVHAVRLAEKRANVPAIQRKLVNMTGDPSLLVRYQLAFSLGEINGEKNRARNTAMTRLVLGDGNNSWMRFAALCSLHHGAGEVFQSLIADAGFRNTAHGREFLISLARQIGAAGKSQEVAAFAQGLQQASDNKSLASSLVEALVRRRSRAQRERILDTAGNEVRRILDVRLAQSKADSVNEKLAVAQRAAAILRLDMSELTDFKPLVNSLLEIRQPPAIQLAAIQTLAKFNDEVVAGMLLEVWPNLSPQLRAAATEALLSRKVWLTEFLQAIETGKVARGDVDPARINLLKQHPHAQLRRHVERLFKAGPTRRADVVRKYQAALKLTGDAVRGKQVFKKTCSACHQLDGVGTAVGAELTSMRQRSGSELLLHIVDPNREVKPKFQSYLLQMRDGRVLTGMIAAESANNLTLRRPDGSSMTVQRNEVSQLRSAGLSFMPEGLEKDISQQAMADLLKYLTTVE